MPLQPPPDSRGHLLGIRTGHGQRPLGGTGHRGSAKRYRYDRFGRLCEKRIGSNWVQYFEYDAEQRLICVDQYRSGERERVVFRYDPLGRRISKEVYQGEHSEPRQQVVFYWQGFRLLQEIQSGMYSLFIYANTNGYEPLARIDGSSSQEDIHYFHTNLAGLPEQLTDSNGDITWRSDYHGWGKTHGEWHRLAERRQQNLRHQGQYADIEISFYYNIFRLYDPDLGRFTQPDPIGLMGNTNLYPYPPNPTTYTDPLGLDWNYVLVDSSGPYYHGRASDKETLKTVARRHSKNKGIDGYRFQAGDTIHQVTPVGTRRDIVRGIEDIGSRENGVLGRGTGRVRGNVDPGISDKNRNRPAYLAQAGAYLESKGVTSPTKLPSLNNMAHPHTPPTQKIPSICK
ncbi:RHS domain-containing protein [Pseudomonas shirazica]|nr:RHS domain-containing protein [Pseudomonas shirazica]